MTWVAAIRCTETREEDQATNPKYSFFMGIDVSKHKPDLALLHEGKVRAKVIENSAYGYAGLQCRLVAQGGLKPPSHSKTFGERLLASGHAPKAVI